MSSDGVSIGDLDILFSDARILFPIDDMLLAGTHEEM